MPLSWNEIKDRALKFSQEWANECSENAEAKSFLDAFFQVFGISRRRIASFEQRVKKLDNKDGYIDLLWKGHLLIEQKSRGKNLDRAFQQATDYFPGLKERDLPRYILVSDFARFRLYDLETQTQHEFPLVEFYKNVQLFGFIAGYHIATYKEQDPVNIDAAERMGLLHDKLKAIGYTGHELEVYLVRLLFCLFADNTSIFGRWQFQELIEQRTAEDGQDLAQWLANLFEVLNTPPEKRLTKLDEQLAAFPYINGHLYAEHLPTAAFDREMRELLLKCCDLDWSQISPAIFGALFQSVMDSKLRRNLGAHYTSEKNIRKLIGPLFLDDLRAEFTQIKNQPRKLMEFQQNLANLKFLDPACGCGNFLVITYQELRLLELEVLLALNSKSQTLSMDVAAFEILCNVDQFYGIEIEEFPAQIAQTALWLMDHQMNLRVSEAFGKYFARLPLIKSAKIVHGNALQLNWQDIVKPTELSFILGNPPFIGAMVMKEEQRLDMATIFGNNLKGYGILDYVAAWYRKAVEFMANYPTIKTAFVSTNSIIQGEQVGVLWSDLLKRGVKIHFAHRTFQWSSEAKGKAAVHCVIIGFALHDRTDKRIFDYEDIKEKAHEIKVANINPYLVDAPNLLLENRNKPLCQVPYMRFGNMPRDGGNFLFSDAEKVAFLQEEPEAKKWFYSYMGSQEFINNEKRWCLWLVNVMPTELRKLPKVMERIEEVRKFRLASKAAATRKFAATPTVFCQIAQPTSNYLLIPRVSSERRMYIPIGFLSPEIIASDATLVIPDATHYHFGVLQSLMHMAWMRAVCGRLKSDYRYSKDIVYNNFPWPDPITDKQRQDITTAAQAVLDTRARYPNASLADLYDPLTMPPDLVKAHRQLDALVDAAYSKKKFMGDSDRVAFLFERYQQLASPLDVKPPKKAPRRNKKIS